MDFSGLTITGGMVITPQSRYAIFAGGALSYATNANGLNTYNVIDNLGTVLAESQNVTMSTKQNVAGGPYGGDKGILFHGSSGTSTVYTTNLVSNTGVVFGDINGVGVYRNDSSGAGYGIDKALFVGGSSVQSNAPSYALSSTSKVSNTGVVSNNTASLVTARNNASAATYGVQNIIVNGGYNISASPLSSPEWFDNNATSVNYTFVAQGANRILGAAAEYGYDKAIFGLGSVNSSSLCWFNRVTNTGYFDVDVAFAGLARLGVAAAGYGIDTCMFLGGYNTVSVLMVTNKTLVNNLGNFVSDAVQTGFTAKMNHAGTHL